MNTCLDAAGPPARTAVSAAITVCDSEYVYALRLQEYLQGQKFNGNAAVFSSRGLLDRSLREGKTDSKGILVIGEREYRERPVDWDPARILILNESGAYEGDSPRAICKYQNAAAIALQIRRLCLDLDLPAASLRHGPELRVIGFHTPLTGCLQTGTALCLARKLAEREPVLYLNLEAWPCLEQLTGLSFEGSLGDLIYFNDCAPEKVAARLVMMERKLERASLLPPVRGPEELRAIQTDQWLRLLETIGRVTEYKYLILDLGPLVNGLQQILARCGRIFRIIREDPLSAARDAACDRYLQERGGEEVQLKTRKILLPSMEEPGLRPAGLRRDSLYQYAAGLADRIRAAEAGNPQ